MPKVCSHREQYWIDPTFRAVVDSEIAPLFDLFLGLSAWIPVYSLHVEKIYDNQGLVIALQDTSATDVI